MAYTSVIPVYRLDNAVRYAQDKQKTTRQHGMPLAETVDYALNREKTETDGFESGLGCTTQSAYEDMRANAVRWHKTDGVQGYHLVQSFAEGEVTPELAHKIGLELAERVLGGRYQAIVTTHLNTSHYHNHIVWSSVAMNSGTQAAKEAGNMVDLDNDPTKLIEIVEIGKQLLMTRGTLTTFSIANDVAKYFAIVPALFMTSIPALGALNIMHLASPESAILSAVIFNAIIIPLLIPLALRGVAYKPIGASALLRRNLFIYGLGGIIAPFIGIKLIDMFISMFF